MNPTTALIVSSFLCVLSFLSAVWARTEAIAAARWYRKILDWSDEDRKRKLAENAKYSEEFFAEQRRLHDVLFSNIHEHHCVVNEAQGDILRHLRAIERRGQLAQKDSKDPPSQ